MRIDTKMNSFNRIERRRQACRRGDNLPERALAVAADGDVYAAAGPTDLEAYAAGRDTTAGLRGIFKGRFTSPGR